MLALWLAGSRAWESVVSEEREREERRRKKEMRADDLVREETRAVDSLDYSQ